MHSKYLLENLNIKSCKRFLYCLLLFSFITLEMIQVMKLLYMKSKYIAEVLGDAHIII